MVRSSFLVALQTVYCNSATPVERGILKISRKLLFGHINAAVKVFHRVAKWRNFSCHFAKSDSTTRSPGNFENALKNQGKYFRWSQFLVFSYRWVVGQFELLKRSTTKEVFLGIFQNFRTWRTYEVTFYKTLISRSNPVISVKWRHRPFSYKLPTFSEENISLRVCFCFFRKYWNAGL